MKTEKMSESLNITFGSNDMNFFSQTPDGIVISIKDDAAFDLKDKLDAYLKDKKKAVKIDIATK